VLSPKIIEFQRLAKHYRELKHQMTHLPTRQIYEQMETSYRILARSEEQLERSRKHVEAIDQRADG
jgi:hypothetical protein